MSLKANRGIRRYLPSKSVEWDGTIVKRNGSATVSGNPLYSWVQKDGGGQPIPVYNDGSPHVAGQRVRVGADLQNRLLRVLRGVYYSGMDQSENPNVGPHAASHLKGGSDAAFVTTDQVINALVYPSSGMIVAINPGWVVIAGQPVQVAQTTLDLTSSIPGTGALYALIRADASGVVDAQLGTAVDAIVDLSGADIPACAAAYAPLAVVRLYAGQTGLSKTATAPDVLDVRLVARSTSAAADGITVDASGFAGNLSGTDTSVQAALETIDALSFGTSDDYAIHDNVSGEIAAVTEKATPAPADLVLIEDSAASNAKKRVQLSSILDLLGPGLCQGRLTLESGVPVSTSNQSAKTTLYFCPFRGNRIALYDGSGNWDLLTFAELSLSLSGFTASKPYDIFAYNNSGAAALEALVWTDASTRATALAWQDGILVKSGATTRRYLGTIYVNSAGGQTDDALVKRNVWNYYNRCGRRLYVSEATGHSYNGAARLWNNSETNNRMEFIVGVVEDALTAGQAVSMRAGADGSYARTDVYIDGAFAGFVVLNYNIQTIVCGRFGPYQPAAGMHYINLYELGNHASSTFSSMEISATVMA